MDLKSGDSFAAFVAAFAWNKSSVILVKKNMLDNPLRPAQPQIHEIDRPQNLRPT
jgi:hypothetical protein